MSDSQLAQILAQQQTQLQGIIDVDEPVIKLVVFRLSEQNFAFTGGAIKEILSGTETVFFVPGMPPSVEGHVYYVPTDMGIESRIKQTHERKGRI